MGPTAPRRAAGPLLALALLLAGAALAPVSFAQEEQEYYYPQDAFLAADLQGGFTAQGPASARSLLQTKPSPSPQVKATVTAAAKPAPKLSPQPSPRSSPKPSPLTSPKPAAAAAVPAAAKTPSPSSKPAAAATVPAATKTPSPSPKVSPSVLPKPTTKSPSPAPAAAPTASQAPKVSPKPASSPPLAAKPATISRLINAAAAAVNKAKPAPSPAAAKAASSAPASTVKAPAAAVQKPAAASGCTLAQKLLGKCGAASPSPSPSPAMRRPAPLPPATWMERSVANGSCQSTMLPNGDFEADASITANKLIGWAKIKENSTVGGGGLYNGSAASYSGYPAVPFNSSNRYFRTRQAGDIAFALVTNQPFTVPDNNTWLYFDWFVDNPWPYYFISETMSINANNSDVIQHQVRVDIYDWDLLVPAGNLTDLAQQMFYEWDPRCCEAFVTTVLPPEAVAAAGNLVSMSTQVPLSDQEGRRLLLALRYSTNVYNIAFGIDNVQLVQCKPGYMEAYTGLEDYDGPLEKFSLADVFANMTAAAAAASATANGTAAASG